MNDARRKKLTEASSLLDQARTLVDEVKDDEQDAFDNMPEGLQQGDKGEVMEETISSLEEISTNIEGMRDDLDSITGATS